MNVKWATAGLVTIIAALAIALGLKSCQGTPEPKIPPALAKSIDSLEITKAPAAAHRDSVIRITVIDSARARQESARGDSARAAAQSLQRIADSLATIAENRADSGRAWHNAYSAEVLVADSLRRAYSAKDSALAIEAANTRRLLTQLHVDSTRTNAIQDANDRLIKRINELEVPCRLIGRIPCPSRTATMVLSVVGATVAENATIRKH